LAISLPAIFSNIKAPAGTNPADAQSAADQLAVTYQPKEASITNTINQLQSTLQSDTQAQQQYGQTADQKIADIGNTLAGQLQGNVGAIGDIYQKGTNQVGAAYDEEAKTLGDVGASVQGNLAAHAKALGQSQALTPDIYGTDPLSRLQGNFSHFHFFRVFLLIIQ